MIDLDNRIIPQLGTALQEPRKRDGEMRARVWPGGPWHSQGEPRFAPAIPHDPAADPNPGSRYEGALAGLERIHDLTRPVRPDGQEGRRAALAPRP